MHDVFEFLRQNWGWLLSFCGVFGGMLAYVISRIKALRLGVQALLRAQMISDYNHYADKGWAPIYARENFENCWVQYEALGKNGVMKDIHNKFMAFPTDPPRGQE